MKTETINESILTEAASDAFEYTEDDDNLIDASFLADATDEDEE